jgi:hypothetical protein
MSRRRLAITLLATLALAACTDGGPTSPSGTGTRDVPGNGPRGNGFPGGVSGGGDTTTTNPGDTTSTNPADTTGAGDPVTNGTWTMPGDSTAVIQPVDPGTYDPAGSGTAGTSGSSTALVFSTSGAGLYGVGTCGPSGMWTDPAGNVFGPNNPNCLSYGSAGAGNNGKGQCTTSTSGQPGLWINPGGQATHPFHSKCLRTGPTITTLALSFASPAQLFDANDGTGNRVMNFYSGGTPIAQLIYDGNSNTTSGAGILVGTDNASPARTWTIFFGQPALSYTGGAANGDLIGDLTGSGVQVVACSTQVGCSLVMLQLTLTP